MQDTWKVTRHGGRHTDRERNLVADTEEKARARYASEVEKLRQGTVRLIRPDGAVEAVMTAHRNRTRW